MSAPDRHELGTRSSGEGARGPHLVNQPADASQHGGGFGVEIQRVRNNPDPSVLYHVIVGFLLPLRLDQMPARDVEHRAVGQQLIEVRLREPAGLFRFVLGVHHDAGDAPV